MSLNIGESLLRKSDKITMRVKFDNFSPRELSIVLKHLTTGVIRDSWAATSTIAESIRLDFGDPFISLDKFSIYFSGRVPKDHAMWGVIDSHHNMCKVADPHFKLDKTMEEWMDKYYTNCGVYRAEDSIFARWRRHHPIPLRFTMWDNSIFTKFKKDIGIIPTSDKLVKFIDDVRSKKIESYNLILWNTEQDQF